MTSDLRIVLTLELVHALPNAHPATAAFATRSELGAVFEYGLAGSLVWQAYAVFGIDSGFECALFVP